MGRSSRVAVAVAMVVGGVTACGSESEVVGASAPAALDLEAPEQLRPEYPPGVVEGPVDVIDAIRRNVPDGVNVIRAQEGEAGISMVANDVLALALEERAVPVPLSAHAFRVDDVHRASNAEMIREYSQQLDLNAWPAGVEVAALEDSNPFTQQVSFIQGDVYVTIIASVPSLFGEVLPFAQRVASDLGS